MSQFRKQRKRLSCARTYLLVCMMAAAAAIMALPAAGTAGTEGAPAPESRDFCVGLECDPPGSRSRVPEALEDVPAMSGLEELKAQKDSGFYEVPAPMWSGEVQPRSVVYLAKAGHLDRMPESVRDLAIVRDLVQTPGFSWEANDVLIVDQGILGVIPAERAAVAARPRARVASLGECSDRYFCIWDLEDYIGLLWKISGADWTGTGWHNMYGNMGASMANYREGDSLLADGSAGGGTRYCAIENSVDSSFDNNAIGNYNASSWALLRRTDNRC